MKIPIELENELIEQENKIDSNGELPAYCRKKIHEIIKNLSDKEHRKSGYYRRSKLSICCSLSCMDIINTDMLGYSINLIDKSISTLANEFNLSELEKLNNNYYTMSINLLDKDNPDFNIVAACLACNSAVNVILYDYDFSTLGVSEIESDPSNWTPSFYASIAISGGAIWETNNELDRRKNYWLWYLKKALPYAWSTNMPLNIEYIKSNIL